MTAMRKFLPLLFLLLGAIPAQAMDFGFDGYVDGRVVAAGNERPWLDGGLGKLRYGNGDAGMKFGGAVGQGYVLLTPEILAVAVIRTEPQQRKTFDALEAYIRYRPVSTTAWRWSLKLGAFFPPFSLENTELGWTSYWTLTPSAINSWVGDELRTIGGESSLEWRREEGTLTFTGALFMRNDPAGVIMADRGWSLDDRPTGLFDHLSVPDASLIAHGAPFPDDTPIFAEFDHRLGWYAGASWDDAMQWHLELLRYDNRADPSAHSDDYFAWRTKFWSAGASYKMDEFTLLAQAMTGDTVIEPFGGFYSTTDFDSAYALLGWERGQWRLAARADIFHTRNITTFGPGGLGENGDALTLAASFFPKDWLRLTGEVLAIDSNRPERMIVAVAPHQSEVQTQLSVRIYF
jgi:hypothetical protein